MSQTYYFHTSKHPLVKMGIVPVTTIALKKEGDIFKYGISICSKDDNFSKKYGREVAERRLELGFGEISVPEVIKHLSEREACLEQIFNLANGCVSKRKKWKRRVTSFNMKQEAKAAVTE